MEDIIAVRMADATTAETETEGAGLELHRWDARFLDRTVERSFLDDVYARDRASRLTRIVSSWVLWGTGCLILYALRPEEFARELPWAGGVICGYVALLVVARWQSRYAYQIGLALMNAGSGVAVAYLTNWVMRMPHTGLIGVAVSVFFGLANPVVPVRFGAISVLPTITLELIGLSVASQDAADFVACTVVLPMMFAVAAGLAMLSHRASRNGFRQRRIIESQRATIERQKEMLRTELSHQVAERSRELGSALSLADGPVGAAPLNPGERFGARYKVVRALGAGGMGAVYEVERVTDGQHLALKVVPREVTGAAAARFAREAEIGARVHHDNLVSIVDVGVSPQGAVFLAMELVEGGSLEDRRDRFGQVAWAVPILRQIAAGIAALHEAGVVHRDLKPGNVLLSGRDGAPTAKISDFGISRFGAIDDSVSPNAATIDVAAEAAGALTGTNALLGTPLYMAPEAARGAREVDAPADVFAFGIIGYELLTGRAPFAMPPVLLALAGQRIVAPSAIEGDASPSVRSVVLRCLEVDPKSRPRIPEILAALSK